MKLYQKIIIGLVLGLIAGLLLGDRAEYLKPVGDIFIRCLRLIVLPLILGTLVTGIVSTGDIRSMGKVGGLTFAYFMITTVFAVGIGLFFANIIGAGTDLTLGGVKEFVPPKTVGPAEMIVNIFPVNPFEALSKGTVLQVIVFAIFLGVGICMAGDKGKPLGDFFKSLSEVMFKISDMVISVAPIGVFALIAWTAGKYGTDILKPMALLILTGFVASLCHIVLVYPTALVLLARVSPVPFFKKIVPPLLVGFTTCSAAAAFPLTMKAQERLGVSQKVYGFSLPLALTINMDGTAVYQAVAALFVANVYGISLDFTAQLTLMLTAVLASIGAASIPGAGLIMLTMVLQSVGLSLDAIAMVAGVDRIMDMFRTSTNVAGDNSSGVIVASLMNELDRETFQTPTHKLEEQAEA